MTTPRFQDKPSGFPEVQVNGKPLKPITEILLERRATAHFKSDPVPEEYLKAILRLAAQAPSGYNLQPWRFIVVHDEKNRQRLQKAALDQPKVGEAPTVIITFAIKDEWKTYIEAVVKEGVRRGVGKPEQVEQIVKKATGFMEKMPAALWLSKHSMIALTTMMLVAEGFGLDTAPMEGFDPEAVKREFKLPANAEVIALLAIGFAKEPDKAYGGRFAIEDIVHAEEFGTPWQKD